MQATTNQKRNQRETKKSRRQMQPHVPTRAVTAAIKNILTSLGNETTLETLFTPAPQASPVRRENTKTTRHRVPITKIYRTRQYFAKEVELNAEIKEATRKAKKTPIRFIYMTRQRTRGQEIIETSTETTMNENSTGESDENLIKRLEEESKDPQHNEFSTNDDNESNSSFITGTSTPKCKKPYFLLFPQLNYRELNINFWGIVESFIEKTYWSHHIVSDDVNGVQVAVFLRGEEEYPEDETIVKGLFGYETKDIIQTTRVSNGKFYKDEYVFQQTTRFKKSRYELLEEFNNGTIKSLI
jgi:hypothetical protein